jgi:hypothetical protein
MLKMILITLLALAMMTGAPSAQQRLLGWNATHYGATPSRDLIAALNSMDNPGDATSRRS